MPPVQQKLSSVKANVLCVGNPGSGKTGALLSLAAAGYKIRVLDLDNGSEILAQMAKPTDDILVETVTETYTATAGGQLVPSGKAYAQAIKLLDKWPVAWDEEGKPTLFEAPKTWGQDTVLVIDSLTRFGEFAMSYVLRINNRLNGEPARQSDWGAAISMQESVLGAVCSSMLSCHVLVLSHVKLNEDETTGVVTGLPNALGNKLPSKVGSYFNSLLFFKTTGSGAATKRQIFTKSPGLVDTKTPAPGRVKPSYPQETGLAEYFFDLLQKSPRVLLEHKSN